MNAMTVSEAYAVLNDALSGTFVIECTVSNHRRSAPVIEWNVWDGDKHQGYYGTALADVVNQAVAFAKPKPSADLPTTDRALAAMP